MTIQTISSDATSSITIASQDKPVAVSSLDGDNFYNITGLSSEVIIKKGYSPFINEETGTWFEYDNDKRGFIDTGVIAAGGTAVEFRNRFEFPNIGTKDIIYVAKDENAMYRFDTKNNSYVLIGNDYHEVESIQCKLREDI